MKINKKAALSSAVCAALVLGLLGTAAGAVKAEPMGLAAEPKAAVEPLTAHADAAERDQVVYVFNHASGETDRVTVSDWFRDGDGEHSENYDTEEQLPVTQTVRFELEGREMSPSELAGKSGHVKLTCRFDSTQTVTVQTEAGARRVPVPFAAVTVLVLDNDRFSHVEVSGGSLINDGDRSLVAGFTVLGARELLNGEKTVIPEELVIEADVENFALGNSLSLVSSNLFRLDADGTFDLAGQLSDAAAQMADAVAQLKAGAGRLAEGLDQLQEQSGDLIGGVGQLQQGADSLSKGAGELKSGLDTLSGGAAQLQSGLDTLSRNSAGLNEGAGQIFELLLQTANGQLKQSGMELPELTRENYAQVLGGTLQQLQSQLGALEGAQDPRMQAQSQQLAAAVQALTQLKGQLDSYQRFYQGLTAYTAGVDAAGTAAAGLSGGAAQLQQGSAALKSGADQLKNGVGAMAGRMPALEQGVTQLQQGGHQLLEGLETFDREGIQKLTAALQEDLGRLTGDLQALTEAARRYTGLGEACGSGDSTRFVFRTESIR